jgi:hypothetical protein
MFGDVTAISVKTNLNAFTANLDWKYAGATKMRLTTAGALYIDAALTQNYTFSLDLVDNQKWDLLNGLAEAYKTHDKTKAPELLRHRIDDEDEFGKTGTFRYAKNHEEYMQVLIECVADLKKEVDELKNAKVKL